MRLTRLYMPEIVFNPGQKQLLSPDQSHYLLRVLRMEPGRDIVLFNEHSGAWLATLQAEGKKAIAELREQIQAAQPPMDMHLLISPLKKEAWDFTIEKATEQGVGSIMPVLLDYTQNARINEERTRANLIEAAQQCERTDIPELRRAEKLPALLKAWPKDRPLYVALERSDAQPALAAFQGHESGVLACILIGPEGGFSPAERELFLKYPFIRPVSLGHLILRAETAALTMLAVWGAQREVYNRQ